MSTSKRKGDLNEGNCLEVLKSSHSLRKACVSLIDGCCKSKSSTQFKHKTRFTGLEILRTAVISGLLHGTGFLKITLYSSNR
jgi:hypothetical protein